MTENPTEPEAEADGNDQSRNAIPTQIDKLFRTALIIIPIGVLGNVGLSLFTTDRALLLQVTQLPRSYLLVAIVLGIIPWITGSLRLLIWTRFLGHRFRFRDALEVTLATDLGSAVSPTAVGGGLFKWGVLVQRGVSPGVAASLTTLAPFESGLFFAFAIPISIFFTAAWTHPVFGSVVQQLETDALPVVVGASLIGLVTWAAVRTVLRGGFGARAQTKGLRLFARGRRGVRTSLHDARDVYRLIGKNGKSRFALTMCLTAIHWIARYSIISALVAFLGAPVRPVLYWLLQWVVFTLATVIPTPGAAGGAEAAFFVVYSPFLPGRVIGLATAGWRFFTFYLLLLIGALLYIAIGGMRQLPPVAKMEPKRDSPDRSITLDT